MILGRYEHIDDGDNGKSRKASKSKFDCRGEWAQTDLLSGLVLVVGQLKHQRELTVISTLFSQNNHMLYDYIGDLLNIKIPSSSEQVYRHNY